MLESLFHTQNIINISFPSKTWEHKPQTMDFLPIHTLHFAYLNVAFLVLIVVLLSFVYLRGIIRLVTRCKPFMFLFKQHRICVHTEINN